MHVSGGLFFKVLHRFASSFFCLKYGEFSNRYLDRITEALQQVDEQTGGVPITLLAHSAGGWLSRVFLLEVKLNSAFV